MRAWVSRRPAQVPPATWRARCQARGHGRRAVQSVESSRGGSGSGSGEAQGRDPRCGKMQRRRRRGRRRLHRSRWGRSCACSLGPESCGAAAAAAGRAPRVSYGVNICSLGPEACGAAAGRAGRQAGQAFRHGKVASPAVGGRRASPPTGLLPCLPPTPRGTQPALVTPPRPQFLLALPHPSATWRGPLLCKPEPPSPPPPPPPRTPSKPTPSTPPAPQTPGQPPSPSLPPHLTSRAPPLPPPGRKPWPCGGRHMSQWPRWA